jgi:hypothetical protein
MGNSHGLPSVADAASAVDSGLTAEQQLAFDRCCFDDIRIHFVRFLCDTDRCAVASTSRDWLHLVRSPKLWEFSLTAPCSWMAKDSATG